MGFWDFLSKKSDVKRPLEEAVEKPHQSFWHRFSKVIGGKATVDGELLDRLEELLIGADVGMATTLKIIASLERRIARDRYLNTSELNQILQEEVRSFFNIVPAVSESEATPNAPHVILVVGVNGVGKTTTIGKLAARFIGQGKKVVLGSADTFRAAAFEQLSIWGGRVGAIVIGSNKPSDPASVAYDALRQAMQMGADVVVIDTAGRLHTKTCLMNELAKIKKTLKKCSPHAPNEVLLVLDGTTGQNAFLQAEVFTAALQVTGIIVTKLDGTSKGGMMIGIVDQFAIPIQYVGVGERVDELKPFDPHAFVHALFQSW